MKLNHQRIGVALCGAELGGSTHIGILFALEKLGIKPQVIAGTSAGALIASLYAHGYSYDDFRNVVRDFPGLFLLDYGFPLASSLVNLARHRWLGSHVPIPKGVFRGNKLLKYIKRLHNQRLLKMPLYIVATDLCTTNAVAFTNDEDAVKQGYANRSTDLHREILGSCSIPGMFTPVRHRQWMLIDGGIRDLVPVTILRQAQCDKILAVDVLDLSGGWYPVTMADVLRRSIKTLIDEAMESSDLTGEGIFIINPKLNDASWWHSRKPMLANIDLGYEYVMDRQHEILEFLKS